MQEIFKKGQSVFDKAGYEYIYNQKLDNGHLVNKIVEVGYGYENHQGYGYDVQFEKDEGELVVISEVFGTPPKNKQCEEIVALNRAIEELEEKESQVKKSILEKSKELDNVKTNIENEIKKFPNHNKILKILRNDFLCYYVNGDRVGKYEYGKIMFDVETGSIYSMYKDDYCDNYYIGECGTYETLEDAEKAFINNIKTDRNFLSKGLKYYYYAKELFEKYNEKIPEFILTGIEDFKLKEKEYIEKDIESCEKYISNYQDRISKNKKQMENL